MSWLDPLHEQISYLPPWQRYGFLLLPVLFIFFIFYYSSYRGKSGRISQLKKEIRTLELEFNRVRQLAVRLSELKEEHNQLRELLNELVAQLPDSKEIPELLIQISKLGKRSGLEFTLFKPEPEQPKGFYVEIPIKMEMIGGYHEVAKFFERVSKMSRIVNITNIRIGEPKVEDGLVLLRTNCVAVTFRSLTP